MCEIVSFPSPFQSRGGAKNTFAYSVPACATTKLRMRLFSRLSGADASTAHLPGRNSSVASKPRKEYLIKVRKIG